MEEKNNVQGWESEFVKKFNESFRMWLKKHIEEKGALCLPFLHEDLVYDEESDSFKKGEWENADQTHFDINIEGGEYHGKLYQIRRFYDDPEIPGGQTGDKDYGHESWTKIGLPNEFERHYEIDLWDTPNGYTGMHEEDNPRTKGTYRRISLELETLDLLNGYYREGKIFTGEDPELFYNEQTLAQMHENSGTLGRKEEKLAAAENTRNNVKNLANQYEELAQGCNNDKGTKEEKWLKDDK